ncbi:MAG: hypothetical protein LQ350_008265 [Teloschistes chrysophthalmus]|nr:MAG: hypothetical protein LQ350_008265 [Niorma chrysophthalma]
MPVMLLRVYLVSLALLYTAPWLSLGNPLPNAATGQETATLAFPGNHNQQPEPFSPSEAKAIIKTRNPHRRNNEWQLVLAQNIRAISPFHEAAADMREFYRLVGIAASTRWPAQILPRRQLHIVWNRVSMVLVVAGMETIPWDMVASYAATMFNHLNRPGTIANTYDCYYLKAGQGVGFFAGLRLWDMQEAINFFLNGQAGILHPENQ